MHRLYLLLWCECSSEEEQIAELEHLWILPDNRVAELERIWSLPDTRASNETEWRNTDIPQQILELLLRH